MIKNEEKLYWRKPRQKMKKRKLRNTLYVECAVVPTQNAHATYLVIIMQQKALEKETRECIKKHTSTKEMKMTYALSITNAFFAKIMTNSELTPR